MDLLGKSWQDLVQVVADRDPESAATFNHGEDRGHTRSDRLAADVDPVSAQGYAAHGVFREVVAKFLFRILEEAWQFLPQLDRVSASLTRRSLRQHILAQSEDLSIDFVEQGRSFLAGAGRDALCDPFFDWAPERRWQTAYPSARRC
jgi:hypothetical protein